MVKTNNWEFTESTQTKDSSTSILTVTNYNGRITARLREVRSGSSPEVFSLYKL